MATRHRRNALKSCAQLGFAVVCGLTSIGAARASAQAVPPLANRSVIPLWSGPAPSALGTESRDIPTLTVYWPSRVSPDMPAIVVCPGGAYRGVSIGYEGREAQEYLNSLGIAVFVLWYRVGPRYHHPVELGDVQRAMRLVRTNAKTWGIDSGRIGVMGFSAGGHLASTLSTHFDDGQLGAADSIDRASSRPDFSILVYPVISLTAPWTHQGSKTNLLGEHPDSALAKSLSNELMVTSRTPPTFLFHTDTDTLVPAENSVAYYLALRKAGVPAELHVFQPGAHGVAMAFGDAVLGAWPSLLAAWLRANGWVRR